MITPATIRVSRRYGNCHELNGHGRNRPKQLARQAWLRWSRDREQRAPWLEGAQEAPRGRAAHGIDDEIHVPHRLAGRCLGVVDELVGVEKHRPFGIEDGAGVLEQLGIVAGLIEEGAFVLEHREIEALVLERLENIDGLVGAAVIEDQMMIDHRRMMPNEGLDDVVLVQDLGDADQCHGKGAPS